MSGEGIHNPYDDTELMADVAEIQAALVIIDDEIEDLQEAIDAIAALVEAEAILEETGGTLTTDGTEQNVYINNARPASTSRSGLILTSRITRSLSR